MYLINFNYQWFCFGIFFNQSKRFRVQKDRKIFFYSKVFIVNVDKRIKLLCAVADFQLWLFFKFYFQNYNDTYILFTHKRFCIVYSFLPGLICRWSIISWDKMFQNYNESLWQFNCIIIIMTMITLDTYHKLMNNMVNRSVKVIEMLDCTVKGLFIFHSLYCVIKLITFYTRNYILSSSFFFHHKAN